MKRLVALFSLVGILCSVSFMGCGAASADDKKKLLKQADDSIHWAAPSAQSAESASAGAAPSAALPAGGAGYLNSDDDLGRVWDDMDRMHQAMVQRMIGSWGMGMRPSLMDAGMGSTVNSDIAETDKELIITCDLPGVSRDSIKISVEGSTLMVQAVRDAGTDKSGEEDGQKYHYRERSYGSVTRSFHIGSGVDPEQIKATYKDGVLTLRVPKGQSRAVTVPIQE